MADDGTRPWHGFVSGVIAGGSGVIIGHAFDTLKVQAQAGPSAAAAAESQAAVSSISPRGLLRLYRGIGPPLVTTGAIRSLYFGVFENVKARMPAARDLRGTEELPLQSIFVAGAITGATISPITAPFITMKLRQQVQGEGLAEVSRLSGSCNAGRRRAQLSSGERARPCTSDSSTPRPPSGSRLVAAPQAATGPALPRRRPALRSRDCRQRCLPHNVLHGEASLLLEPRRFGQGATAVAHPVRRRCGARGAHCESVEHVRTAHQVPPLRSRR